MLTGVSHLTYVVQEHLTFELPLKGPGGAPVTKLLPAGSFKSVETMHSAQMTALTNEMMLMEFELDVLRRRTAEAQKELEVANTRLVLCWFFGLSFIC